MTEEQRQAVNALVEVDCKMAASGNSCGGPWCTARVAILQAFGLTTSIKSDS